jgi:CheY-like chemotaxis protein
VNEQYNGLGALCCNKAKRPMSYQVLIFEDDRFMAEVIANTLRTEFDASYIIVHTLSDMLEALRQEKFDVVISGMYYSSERPDHAFRDIMLALGKNDIRTPVIFLSNMALPEDTFEMARLGGFDFLTLERSMLDHKALAVSMKSALKIGGTQREFGAGETSYDRLLSILETRFSEVKQILGNGFDDVRQGQIALYRHVDQVHQKSLAQIVAWVRLGLVEQGEMVRTLDAIRRVLRFMQSSKPAVDLLTQDYLSSAALAIDSKLELQQKLEFTLPILPFFLDYKFEMVRTNKADLQKITREVQKQWKLLMSTVQS